MKELVKFIKDRRGHYRGALVANELGVGWSALHPNDRFDKRLALVIARGRSFEGTDVEPPNYIRAELPKFETRAAKYFRW